MDYEIKQHIYKTAKKSAAMEQKLSPGNGYAFIVGSLNAILTNPFSSNDDRVEQCVLLIESFDKELGI